MASVARRCAQNGSPQPREEMSTRSDCHAPDRRGSDNGYRFRDSARTMITVRQRRSRRMVDRRRARLAPVIWDTIAFDPRVIAGLTALIVLAWLAAIFAATSLRFVIYAPRVKTGFEVSL